VALGNRFARELPELAVAWRAEEPPEPRLLVLDEDLAVDLGLDPDWLRTDDGLRLLVGTGAPDDATPVAQAYAGHQFGMYNPRLGDGRALLLGELVSDGGRRYDLHLKGSGRTPFARGGDGLAVVGPMLREYVVSRAMHALGIPTTRSLAVVATGRPVRREGLLPGAVLARVASSHLRVGSFQYVRATDDPDLLRRLADHAIARHHRDLDVADGAARPVGADVSDPQAEHALVGGIGDHDEVVLAEAEAAGGGPLVEDPDHLEALAADANQLADRIDAVRLEQQRESGVAEDHHVAAV